jgi:hypothetical protein
LSYTFVFIQTWLELSAQLCFSKGGSGSASEARGLVDQGKNIAF